MMYPISKKAALLIFLSLGVIGKAQKRANLTVRIENVYIKKGYFYVAIFNSENSFMKNPYKKIRVSHRTNRIIFNQLPAGKYSATIYQDLNNDHKLNKIFSIPTEPYGVSNNPAGYPSFDNSAFNLTENQNISINLKN